MTDQQAKDILLLYRPNSPDANDAEFTDALARVSQSPELKSWFENHCAVQETIRAKFRQITVPDGFKEQIISEYKARQASRQMRRRVMLAAAAMLLALGVIAALQLHQRARIANEESLAVYRSRMVRSVLLAYSMDLETNDLAQVRSYLSQHQALADWVLTPTLERTATTGCGVLKWQGRPVSMICFRTGKSLAPGQKSDMYLFVIDSNDLRERPGANIPEIAQVLELMTASWNAEGKTYVLAVEGDETLLRKFL